MANSTKLILEPSLSKTGTFSVRHFTVVLCLGTLDSTSTLYLGAVLNSEITSKKKKKHSKGTLVYSIS